MPSSARIAIIGAGLAGIAAARRLTAEGHQCRVFEKSRGYGGRCATKRWEGHRIDHGAQYFTLRNEAFRAAVITACGDSIQALTAPVVNEGGAPLIGEPRWYHTRGNSHLARALAGELDIHTEHMVDTISPEGDGWNIMGDRFDRVLSTAPLPQTLKLAGIPTAGSDYIPCLTLLLLYAGEYLGRTAERYAVSDRSGHALAWSACENHKQGRVLPGFTALVVQASLAFSEQYLEADSSTWAPLLRLEVEERWELSPGAFLTMHPHRWRYARVESPIPSPSLPKGWAFAGDALTESRLESAWLAGWNAAAHLDL